LGVFYLPRKGGNTVQEVNKAFIEIVHGNSDGLIEIKEIQEATPGQETKIRLHYMGYNKFKSYEVPQDRHVYFSIYTRAKGNGSAKNCLTTNVLWADYDGKSLAEVKAILDKANIPTPTIYVNSGYGVHAYWKLNKRIGHEATDIVKAIVKITGADTSATDVARVMRLPGSNNVKHGACKPCRVVEVTHMTYDISKITRAVQSELKAFKTHTGITTGKYCIDQMLQGVGKGHRNFALGRITKQLQFQGYTRSKALEEILNFNNRCEPSKSEKEVITDFNAYWEIDYKLLGCSIADTRLQSILSVYCDKAECKHQKSNATSIDLDNATVYNNRTVLNRKTYNDLPGNELIVIGILKKYPQGLNRSRLEQCLYSPGAKQSLMTSKTLEKVLTRLQELKFIEFMEIAKDRGNNYKNYFAKYIDQSEYGKGFTLVSNGAIMGAIDKRITPNQYKLYVLLLKYGQGKGEAFPSNETLADMMGTSKNTVMREAKQLEEVGYIDKSYVHSEKGIKKCNYRLLI
jgi:hypothetical protein